MKLKKFMLLMGCVMLMSLMIQITAMASYSITNITPSEGVGVYERGTPIEFTISYTADEDTFISFSVSDIWGEVKKTGGVLFSQSEKSVKLTLGTYNVGWYRVKFSESGNLNKSYCAFSVVPEYSTRYIAQNPFAVDQAGQYTSWSNKTKDDYARALKLAGIDTARERFSDTDANTYDKEIESTVSILNDNGIKTMEMLARGKRLGYDASMFDVYNVAKLNAEHYGDKIAAWEGVNEADAESNAAPDEVASYMKARMLGILDSGVEVTKTFGGLCVWNNDYRETFMQNDILSYADVYNLHSHRTYDTEVYQEFPSDPVYDARELTTVYGGGKPVWVSEAGISCEVDENEVLLDKNIPVQAKYVITSAVESIARGGTDKHFMFISRHFMENGREFGIFSKNNLPYAAYSALANMTYYLGEGKPLGDLRERPDNCRGYMFNDGSNDVAVVWNTEKNKTDYVQFNTDYNVEVINLVGDATPIIYSQVNHKVNLPVTEYPIIVKFKGETKNNYFPKPFPKYESVNVTSIPDSKRIILKQTWGVKDVTNARYNIKHGTNYPITLQIYNFSDNDVKGTINMELSDLLTPVSSKTARYSVKANSRTVVSFTVKANDDYAVGGKANISFSGTANDEEISPSVAVCSVASDQSKMSVTYFNNCNNTSYWTKNTSGVFEMFPQSTNQAGMHLKHSFAATNTNRWAYPYLRITQGTLSNSNGLTFSISANGSSYKLDDLTMRVFVWDSSDNQYIATLGTCKNGTNDYRVPWTDFVKQGNTTAELNVSKINRVSVGFNASQSSTSVAYGYTLSNFGYFSGNTEADKTYDISISGIGGKKYVAGWNYSATAWVPSDLKDIKVYHNYKEIDYGIDNDGKLSIFLGNVPEGANKLTVTARDKFNYAVRKSVDFYAADYSNVYVKGTLFE